MSADWLNVLNYFFQQLRVDFSGNFNILPEYRLSGCVPQLFPVPVSMHQEEHFGFQ
jgi:hypothetical protein